MIKRPGVICRSECNYIAYRMWLHGTKSQIILHATTRQSFCADCCQRDSNTIRTH